MPTPRKEARMWTKEEIRTVMKLWESHNTEAIAEILGRDTSQITQMAARIRKAGKPLIRKRRNGTIELLIKEVLSEPTQ